MTSAGQRSCKIRTESSPLDLQPEAHSYSWQRQTWRPEGGVAQPEWFEERMTGEKVRNPCRQFSGVLLWS